MIVRQLGNGNAFTPEITNTSFTLMNDKILVDCGYNVFQKIKELKLEDTIEYVFITHAHDDHIGSLMSFLYYREFVSKKPITVYVNEQTYNILKPFTTIYNYPNTYKPMKYVEFSVIREKGIKVINENNVGIIVDYMEVNSHGNLKNIVYKFCIKDDNGNNIIVVITGDTKANKEIEHFTFSGLMKKGYKLIVFHDYSFINHPDNTHACEYDFEEVYSDLFKKYVVKVHTGLEYFEDKYDNFKKVDW